MDGRDKPGHDACEVAVPIAITDGFYQTVKYRPRISSSSARNRSGVAA
jgi:hypothetical protein